MKKFFCLGFFRCARRREEWKHSDYRCSTPKYGWKEIFHSLGLVQWQVPLASKAREETAFATSEGLCKFPITFFRLNTSHAVFQLMADTVLHYLLGREIFFHIDDIMFCMQTRIDIWSSCVCCSQSPVILSLLSFLSFRTYPTLMLKLRKKKTIFYLDFYVLETPHNLSPISTTHQMNMRAGRPGLRPLNRGMRTAFHVSILTRSTPCRLQLVWQFMVVFSISLCVLTTSS